MKPKKEIVEKDPLSAHKQAWFVTINTNSSNTTLIGPLKLVWKHILSNITTFTYGRGYITKVIETNQTVEQGKKFKRLHIHTKVEIQSNGIAYLDFVKIQQFINKNMRQIPSFKGIYVNAHLIKNYNQQELIDAYTGKDPYLEASLNYPGFQIIE
jgi:hypothetical protein